MMLLIIVAKLQYVHFEIEQVELRIKELQEHKKDELTRSAQVWDGV